MVRGILWRTAAVLLVAMAATACGDSSSTRNPAGPAVMSGANPASGGGMNGPAGGGPMGPGNGPMGPGTGSSMMVTSEFDYLVKMIPHHEEAIAAAGELARSSRPEMRQFGLDIIATQSAEVAQMKTWLASWYTGRDTSVDYRPMMRDLTGLTGDALDRAFLEDMIPHHMMAVMMSQQLINRRLAVQPAVVPFATNIRDTQQAEIRTMRTWLYQWFGV